MSVLVSIEGNTAYYQTDDGEGGFSETIETGMPQQQVVPAIVVETLGSMATTAAEEQPGVTIDNNGEGSL